MRPSVRCLWGVCSPRVMATSVQMSTSSSAATRPVVVGAAVCAQHCPTTLTSAPNMASTLISDHKSLSVVSVWPLGCFYPYCVKILVCIVVWPQMITDLSCAVAHIWICFFVFRTRKTWSWFTSEMQRIKCVLLCVYVYRSGVSWRHAVPRLCVVLRAVLSWSIQHGDV